MEVVKNETEEKMPITIPMEKFPRLEAIGKTIANLKELVENLNKRKEIIKSDQEEISKFEKNERKILLCKTDIELAKVHTGIIAKERDIKEYLDKIVYPYINEIETEFDVVMAKARERAKKDGVLASVMNEVDYEMFKENWEHKFNHYIAISITVNGYGLRNINDV